MLALNSPLYSTPARRLRSHIIKLENKVNHHHHKIPLSQPSCGRIDMNPTTNVWKPKEKERKE
jgi:hypothetical protein